MMREEIWLVFSLALGCVSLFGLLSLLRNKLPSLFGSDTKKIAKVSSFQQNIGDNHYDIYSNRAPSENLLKSIKESSVAKKSNANLTLAKKLKFARWKISTTVFRLFELFISCLVFSLTTLHFNFVIQFLSLFIGPLVMHFILGFCIDRRSKRFDQDYPHFLMSMVGLLKTGMTAMGALETAAAGLDPSSLVREEVELMIERTRVGVLEDRSIGAFGEDIYHAEIELFVQALLLSRRVGGNLSDTIERLSRQVRKRQYFRSSADAAVGLQRASILVIIGILVSLQLYIGLLYPAIITKGIQSEVGWNVWQVCIAMIFLAIVWAKQVTKIKV